MNINEINVELSDTFQRFVNECCECESDGKIDGSSSGCCKRRGGGVAIAAWCMASHKSLKFRIINAEFAVVLGKLIQFGGCYANLIRVSEGSFHNCDQGIYVVE
jgi:hypothetical protein